MTEVEHNYDGSLNYDKNKSQKDLGWQTSTVTIWTGWLSSRSNEEWNSWLTDKYLQVFISHLLCHTEMKP